MYLAWAIALELEHVHGVVDPAAEVVELNVPRHALNPHLHHHGDMEEQGRTEGREKERRKERKKEGKKETRKNHGKDGGK